MPRISRLKPEFVEAMPDVLHDGVIYISEKYRIALHNCCCGCGEEVSTPIGPTEFAISFAGDGVSVHPSIGNHDFACRSHYFIKHGAIVWAGEMSRADIEKGRAHDRYIKRGRGQFNLAAVLRWIRALLAKLFD